MCATLLAGNTLHPLRLHFANILDAQILVVIELLMPGKFVDFNNLISCTLFECRFGFLELRGVVPVGQLHLSKTTFERAKKNYALRSDNCNE